MTFADKHELAMLRSTDKILENGPDILRPRDLRQMLDMAFSQGALFVLEDDLHQLEEKLV